jgi:hypothetical protein
LASNSSGNVVLQRALAPTLVVQKVRATLDQHHVARLEITVQEVIAVRLENEFRQPCEISLQRLLVERDARQPQKVVLEIVQVPRNRLPIETRPRIAQLVVDLVAHLHLEARQHGDHFAIRLHNFGRNYIPLAVLRKELVERKVAKVLFEVRSLLEVFCIDLRHWEAASTERP